MTHMTDTALEEARRQAALLERTQGALEALIALSEDEGAPEVWRSGAQAALAAMTEGLRRPHPGGHLTKGERERQGARDLDRQAGGVSRRSTTRRGLFSSDPVGREDERAAGGSRLDKLTPTQIGSRLSIEGQTVNRLLESIGLQEGVRGSDKKLRWVLTEEGRRWGREARLDSCGRWSRILWSPKVVDLLRGVSEEGDW